MYSNWQPTGCRTTRLSPVAPASTHVSLFVTVQNMSQMCQQMVFQTDRVLMHIRLQVLFLLTFAVPLEITSETMCLC